MPVRTLELFPNIASVSFSCKWMQTDDMIRYGGGSWHNGNTWLAISSSCQLMQATQTSDTRVLPTALISDSGEETQWQLLLREGIRVEKWLGLCKQKNDAHLQYAFSTSISYRTDVPEIATYWFARAVSSDRLVSAHQSPPSPRISENCYQLFGPSSRSSPCYPAVLPSKH